MEVTMELEDDLFYADLSKRISLLIMDEDDDPLASSTSDSVQPPPQSGFLYDQALRRQISKGTGVFIPQSTQPRKKHRKGRSSSNSKYQKQSQVPIKGSLKSKNC